MLRSHLVLLIGLGATKEKSGFNEWGLRDFGLEGEVRKAYRRVIHWSKVLSKKLDIGGLFVYYDETSKTINFIKRDSDEVVINFDERGEIIESKPNILNSVKLMEMLAKETVSELQESFDRKGSIYMESDKWNF